MSGMVMHSQVAVMLGAATGRATLTLTRMSLSLSAAAMGVGAVAGGAESEASLCLVIRPSMLPVSVVSKP